MLGPDDDIEIEGDGEGAGGKSNAWLGGRSTLEDVVKASFLHVAPSRRALPRQLSMIGGGKTALKIVLPAPSNMKIPISGTVHAVLLDLLSSTSSAVPRSVKWQTELEAVPRAKGSRFMLDQLWATHGLLWRDSRVPDGQARSGGAGNAALKAEAKAQACGITYTLTPIGVEAAIYLETHAVELNARAVAAAAAAADTTATTTATEGGGGGGGGGGGVARKKTPQTQTQTHARDSTRVPYGPNLTIPAGPAQNHVNEVMGDTWSKNYWSARDAIKAFGDDDNL
jgi:hypothetical protein